MWFRLFAILLLISATASAHNVPSQLPDPQSTAEAWNVIEGSAANIDRLLDANLLRDITFQIANTDSSLRYLIAHPNDAKNPQRAADLCRQMLSDGSDLIGSIREKNPSAEKIESPWQNYRQKLSELESNYTTELLHSDIFICPMHPLDRHLKPDEKCSVCGMPLIRRHLPSSGVYEKPGEPTMKMSVQCLPLVAGQRAEIKIRLVRKADGSPVVLGDLLEMHTKKIHLLINDQSLSEYHHEHPTPTDVPGEYAFGFTPNKPGPYRIWADLVPAASSIQEYVIADIPAKTDPLPLTDREEVTTTTANGRRYVLTLNNNGKPIHVGQTVIGTISVAEADGKPCVSLEPVMGAFAHIVGFNEDHRTVLHIHPYGKEPAGPADRAGPAFAFKFYSPSPGFFRLYGQVQIDNVSQFAPFGVTIFPAEKPATQP